MRKFAMPATVMVGAKKRIDPETFMVERDFNGEVAWELPNSVGYVKHVSRRLDKKTKKVIVEKIKVPVYRGADASLVRYFKSQYKRTLKKQQEWPMMKNKPQMIKLTPEEMERAGLSTEG